MAESIALKSMASAERGDELGGSSFRSIFPGLLEGDPRGETQGLRTPNSQQRR